MRLSRVEIYKYRSIKHMVVELTHTDNIASLIGQNESGKSSVLEALRDFYKGAFDVDSMPYSKQESADEVEQSISCTFEIEKTDKTSEIDEKILNFLNEGIVSSTIKYKKGVFEKIKTFTLRFDGKRYFLDENLTVIIDNAFEIDKASGQIEDPEQDADENGASGNSEEVAASEELDISVIHPDVEQYIAKNLIPEIIYFEGGMCDILPDFIATEDLVNQKGDGWTAVAWLENCVQLLNKDGDFSFKALSEMSSIPKGNKVNQSVDEITADFRTDFRQRIHGVDDSLKIVFNIGKEKKEGDEDYRDYIDFAVETKPGEPLPVRMRSKGMIWFLSFWLALKSLNEKKSIILVDEPDKNLHINAQKDLLSVFEKISQNLNHQIIYATHAPTLVPVDKIYRIYLVVNDDKNGTNAKNILKTQIGNSKNKQEAISLVNYAIGCDVPHHNMVFKNNNVILEGLSDFMHFQAMAKILSVDVDKLAFIPGVGTKGSKLNPLISMCIGYKLKWCVVLDGDQPGHQKFKDIRDSVFAGKADEAEKQLRCLSNNSVIEDLFTVKDIEAISKSGREFILGKKPKAKNNLAYIGKKRKNIFASVFLENASTEKINKADLSPALVSNFEKLFSFIDESIKSQK